MLTFEKYNWYWPVWWDVNCWAGWASDANLKTSTGKVIRITFICAGNSPVTRKLSAQKGPVMRSYATAFVDSLHNVLFKPLSCRRYETPWRSHDVTVMRVFALSRLVMCSNMLLQCVIDTGYFQALEFCLEVKVITSMYSRLPTILHCHLV